MHILTHLLPRTGLCEALPARLHRLCTAHHGWGYNEIRQASECSTLAHRILTHSSLQTVLLTYSILSSGHMRLYAQLLTVNQSHGNFLFEERCVKRLGLKAHCFGLVILHKGHEEAIE
eukprot:1160842-Pelagomonas_calceolata.AAC.2